MQSWPVEELVPHSGDMVLIDRVISASDDFIHVELTVRNDGLFNKPDGSVPAWIGIEYMAQTIAAFAGVKAKKSDEKIKLGFLLGTRHFRSNVSAFPLGITLTVKAHCSIQDESGLGLFNCSITASDICVEADVNVYQPKEIDVFLRENA